MLARNRRRKGVVSDLVEARDARASFSLAYGQINVGQPKGDSAAGASWSAADRLTGGRRQPGRRVGRPTREG